MYFNLFDVEVKHMVVIRPSVNLILLIPVNNEDTPKGEKGDFTNILLYFIIALHNTLTRHWVNVSCLLLWWFHQGV